MRPNSSCRHCSGFVLYPRRPRQGVTFFSWAFAQDKACFAGKVPWSSSFCVNLASDFITATLHKDCSYCRLRGSPISFLQFFSSYLERKKKKKGFTEINCCVPQKSWCNLQAAYWTELFQFLIAGHFIQILFVHSVANNHCLSCMNHWINMNLKLGVSLKL